MSQTQMPAMRVQSCPTCYLCHEKGKILYQNLEDILFGVPGFWGFRQCTNPHCGLIWLDPAPYEEDIGQAYQTYYTHSDGSSRQSRLGALRGAVQNGYLRAKLRYTTHVGPRWYAFLWPLAYLFPSGKEHIDSSVMFLSSPEPGAQLLDVGCGDGQFLAKMRDLGWQVEGNDFDAAAVEMARTRGLRVSHGLLQDQQYPSAHFDAITMSHVIEHIYDPIALLREVRRILKPNGKFVLQTPNAQSLGHRHFKQDWRGLEQPRHIHIFDVTNIRQLLNTAGFTRIYVRTLTRGSRYILTMSEAIRRARLEKTGPIGYGNEKGPHNRYYQLWGRSKHLVQPNSGEELLVIAQ